MTPALALLLGAMPASALLSALAIAYAKQRRMLDLPGPRRSHDAPTPRGGGIAPVLVLLAGGAWVASRDAEGGVSMAVCLSGLALVAGIGWLDDHRPLPASLRLAIHVMAALAAAVVLQVREYGDSDVFLLALATFVVAGLVNAWNFMDGIDGLATTQCGLVVAAMLAGGWLSGAWKDLAWLALGAIAGFLPFNLPRARIFLGDVGSGALGYLVGMLLLRAVTTHAVPWTIALLPAAAFLVDAGLTLARRVFRGRRFWRPHREHLYQWLVRRGWSHGRVDVAYAVATLAASALAVRFAHAGCAVASAVSAGAVLFGGLSWMGIRKSLWTTARHRR